MRLRSQFVALIAASGAVCALVVSGVLLATVLPAFERAEWEEALADGRRLSQALAVESGALGTLARDYAVWDDVYAYLADRDPTFIETGITPDSTLSNLSLDLMQIRDAAGAVVWGAGEVADASLDPGALAPLLGQPGGEPRNAVVPTTQGTLMLAVHPVLTSTGLGPSRGWMLMGRLLDEDWLAEFGRRVDLRVVLAAPEEAPGADTSGVRVLDEGNLAVHAVLRDADGKAALMVRATLPRKILAEGRHAALLAGWLALASLLLVAPLLMFLLERRVTGPISRLTRFIESLAPGGTGGLDRRADEVEVLEHTFHDLMRRLGETEARLREAAERAEDASRAKSLFLATMSHEIRTPLNGVVAAAELLDAGERDETRRQLTGIIRTSAEVLQGTIEEVLDFSKIEAGRVELNPAPFSLVQVLEEAAEVLAVRALAKGLTLVSEVAEGMPDFFHGDSGRLRQILVNLGGNALKFTERGHVALRARPAGQENGRTLIRFEVEDSGIGIAADKQAAIFDPFVQADNSTSRRYGGTGLGLAICRALVASMGGAINLDSEPGRGATMWFTVPLAVLPERRIWPPVDFAGAGILVKAPAPLDAAFCRLLRQLGARPGTDPAGGPWTLVVSTEAVAGDNVVVVPVPVRRSRLVKAVAAALAPDFVFDEGPDRRLGMVATQTGRNLLLAEDHPTNQTVLRLMLERLGHRVEVVPDGLVAWRRLQEATFDLLITDCHMPGLGGPELARRIRAAEADGRPRLPIIALSADARAEAGPECADAGIDWWLTKPVSGDTLRGAIDGTLARVPPPLAATEPPILDTSVLLGDALAGNPDLLAGILREFLAATRPDVETALAALAAGQPEDARRAAHAGKGAARMAGAMALAAAFQSFESAAVADRMDETSPLAARLREVFARTEQAVAALDETDQPPR